MNLRFLLGLFLILSVVFLWVGSSFLTSHIFNESDYDKPIFVTLLNVVVFTGYLFIVAAKKAFRKVTSNSKKATTHFNVSQSYHTNLDSATKPYAVASQLENPTPQVVDLSSLPLTFKQTLLLSVQFSLLWFFANYTTNKSFVFTDVPSATILCSTSGIFTFILGIFAHTESTNKLKLLGVLLSIFGVSLVATSNKQGDGSENNSFIIGNCLALLGAFFYAAYTTLMKLRVRDESRVDGVLFFGLVGLVSLIAAVPALYILDVTGVEKFEVPSNEVALKLLLNASFAFVSDYIWLFATLLTTPVIVTVGLSLSMPLSLLGDYVFYNKVHLNPRYWFGVGLVIAGFILVNLFAGQESSSPPPTSLPPNQEQPTPSSSSSSEQTSDARKTPLL